MVNVATASALRAFSNTVVLPMGTLIILELGKYSCSGMDAIMSEVGFVSPPCTSFCDIRVFPLARLARAAAVIGLSCGGIAAYSSWR